MWYIHVNQHIIRKNINAVKKEPPIAIRRRTGSSRYAFDCAIPAGSRIVYSPDSPILDCGARLVIECPTEPE